MNNDINTLPGRYPAIVKAYDQDTRMCRVEIPGITRGGDVLPLAEIEYSLGDKSRSGDFSTEIEILPGDTVWVSFIGGDPRYPIITGYRNPQTNNSKDWRLWHHDNIKLDADKELVLFAGQKAVVLAENCKVQLESGGDITIDNSKGCTIKISGDSITVSGGNITLSGSSVINLSAPSINL